MRGPRFNLRSTLVWVAIVAMVVGWYASLYRERARSEREIQRVSDKLRQKLGIVETEQTMARIRDLNRDYDTMRAIYARRLQSGKLAAPSFVNADLRGYAIHGGKKAFEHSNFDACDLRGATLTGGDGSFQEASFNSAILRNAKLVGEESSFRLAEFEGADLSDAELSGDLQGALLKNANCAGATIKGSLHSANIDGAQFEYADLTGIKGEDLASCYFATPPTYNGNTKFPAGFDPKEYGWQRYTVSESN